MSEWQDISTAPKDGKRVLVGCFGRVDRASKDRHGTIAVDYWHDRTQHGYEGWGHFNAEMWPASHWMPLPAPPASNSEPQRASA